ncbi:MFS transporter [Kineococcus auxinigenes]|uniref:MFS transporter n=1 Tax=unclassified Kineococcus TaxID=2621656 RepID=UPI003D7D3C68
MVAAAALATVMTAPGQTTGVSAFIDPLIAELGTSRTAVSTAYLIGTLSGALALPLVGRLLDRHGVGPVMAVVGLAFGAVLFAMSFVDGLVGLTAGFAGIRMAGQGALGLAATTAVAVHVTRRRGLALGVTSAVGTGGISLAPVLLERLIAAHGTAATWRIEALAVWLIVLPLALLVFRAPGQRSAQEPRPHQQAVAGTAPGAGEDTAGVPSGGASAGASPAVAADPPRSWTRAEAVRTRMFWAIAAGLAASGMLTTALNFHQISLLGEQGLSAAQAAANFVPQTVAGLAATLGIGALADHIAPKWCVSASMLLLAASLLAVPLVAPGLRAIGYGVLLGAASGALRAIEAAAYARYFGTEHLGSIRGLVTALSVASTAFGPLLLAAGHAITGGYTSTVVLAAVVPLGIAVVAAITAAPAVPAHRVTAHA